MAALITRQQDVARYEHYVIEAYGVVAELWVLPALADRAMVEGLTEMETFTKRVHG